MTQVFDPRTGSVERVTVVEAGPCHVTGIRTDERDGYEAVQLGFGEVAREAPDQAPSSATSRRPARRALRAPRGVPRRGRRAPGRRERHRRDVFEKGQTVKVSGTSKGKGFQGTIKRHNFSRGPVIHGSHNVRAPGSIGASATPSRVFKGIRGPGQMGNKRVTQRGPRGRRRARRTRTCCCCAARCPGPKGSIVEIRTDA